VRDLVAIADQRLAEKEVRCHWKSSCLESDT
jgi:hypothetical protein